MHRKNLLHLLISKTVNPYAFLDPKYFYSSFCSQKDRSKEDIECENIEHVSMTCFCVCVCVYVVYVSRRERERIEIKFKIKDRDILE